MKKLIILLLLPILAFTQTITEDANNKNINQTDKIDIPDLIDKTPDNLIITYSGELNYQEEVELTEDVFEDPTKEIPVEDPAVNESSKSGLQVGTEFNPDDILNWDDGIWE